MHNCSSKDKRQPTVELIKQSVFEEQKKKKQKTAISVMENEPVPLSVDAPLSDVDADSDDEENDLKPSGDIEGEEVTPVHSEDEGEHEMQYLPAEPEGNNIDDLDVLVGWITHKNKTNDKNCKKVYEMIYVMLQIIALDIVYATDKVKTYDVCIRLANELELVMSNIHTATSKNYYQGFIKKLPREELPVEVVKLHMAARSPKLTDTVLAKIPAKERNTRKPEEHVAYLCGSKAYDNAMKVRQEINSNFATKWRPLNSGETRNGLLYAIRQSLFRQYQEKRTGRSCVNKVNYKKKNAEKPLTAEEKEAIIQDTKKKLSEVPMGDWYPKEWLTFVLLSRPAAEQILPFMTPRGLEPEIGRLVAVPHKSQINVKSEDNLGNSSSDTLSTKKSTPAKSPNPSRLEVVHQLVVKLDGMEEYVAAQKEQARIHSEQTRWQQEQAKIANENTKIQNEQARVALKKEKRISWREELNRLQECKEIFAKKKGDPIAAAKAAEYEALYEQLLERGPESEEAST